MKYSKNIAFAIVIFLFLSVNAFSQEHQHQDKKENKNKKPTIMLIGKGEMMYMCPMKEDNVFASEKGKCPECGMNLKKMSNEDKKKMHEMMKTHMAVNEKGEMIKHDPKNNTMLLMGEGEMTYHCPMTEHKVFAAEPGKCSVCGMNLKKMSETDKKRMEKLLKTQKVIRIKKTEDIKTEKHKHQH